MNYLTIVLSGIVIGAYILYKATKRSPFWDIPGPKSNSFIHGHICELLQNQVGLTDFEWQENYGDVVRFKGSFGSEYLMISDPKALQRIFQTSGYRWRKTPQRREFSRLLAGKGLAWADGDVHKRQRKIMLPGFSAPEAKHLLPFFSSCAAALCSRWTDMLSASSEQCQVFNVADWISRATLDAIGQAAFDYDFGATNNQDTELSKLYQNLMIKTFGTPSKTALLMLDLTRYIPLSVMEFLDNHNPRFSLIHRVNNLAHVTAKYLVDMKSGLLLEGKNKKDIMSLLAVKANKEASQNPKLQLSEEELLAQMRVLLFAGHETSGTSLTFALFELVRNPELQTRLRKEIRNTERKIAERGDVEVTAQDLESMPFLNAVVKETLRFHPVAVHLFRIAVEDDVLPLMKPIVATTGEILKEVVVPKGTRIVGSIPAYNSAFDHADAFTFNPDRWLDPGHVKNSVSLGVYANLATFSAGIRSCIGWRFAVLEMQAFLVELIKNFEFSATPALEGIRREPALLMTPSIEGELDKGSQMPLKVAFAKRSDDDS
ncbi:cytochrome P450 [Lentinula edodes]|uniref:Cytochrome P450 n=1 Tax=Lentinula lateritia TaxID=40482 RepID=A0A9W8ZVU4_9AGAR|nr:cytochrome P450 [Lentinula edodes]